MSNQTQTVTTEIRRGRALLAAPLLLFIYAASRNYLFNRTDNALDPASPISTRAEANQRIDDDRRSLSIALPNGGCQVTYAHVTDYPIEPTWQASFPGSGARMTFNLIQALTGIRTNDDYDSHERGYENVVSVKTHYPVKNARRRFGELDQLFKRAMVVLRNPINAVPSYFNLQYEHLNHLPNHSTRGPNEDWLLYRQDPNHGLAVQLLNYENFVTYWMEKYPDRRQLLMISYEDLTDDFVGPFVAGRIADFLGEVEGVDPIVSESVPCVWQTIVNYKDAPPPPENVDAATLALAAEQAGVAPPENTGNARRNNKREGNKRTGDKRRALEREEVIEDQMPKLQTGKTFADPSSLRTGPKDRPYTEQNLADMLAMFQRLANNYSYDEDFMRIISSYIETVSNTAPVED